MSGGTGGGVGGHGEWADARRGEGEVLAGVRELLQGQRRLEQLLAGLGAGAEVAASGGPGRAGADVEAGGGPRPGAPAAERGLPRGGAGERSEAKLALCGAPSPCLLGDVGSWREEASEGAPEGARLWLERADVREELATCGSGEQLAKECHITRTASLSRTGRVVRSQSVRRFSLASPRSRGLRSRCSGLCHGAVLSPAGQMRAWLDVVSLAVLAYNVLSIPYMVSFPVDTGAGLLGTLEFVSAVFWSVDLLMNFRTGFYQNGELHMQPGKIARHYLSSSFLLDLVTLLVDVVAIVLQSLQTDVSRAQPLSFIRIFKIGRIARLMGVMRMRNLSGILDRLGHSSGAVFIRALSRPLVNICGTAALLIWINHTIACFWCLLGREGGPGPSWSDTGFTWMDLRSGAQGEIYGHYGHFYQYTTAWHWSLTQMTPGSMQVVPVNSAERIFNIVCLMGGLLVFSTLVSTISANAAQLKIDMQRHSREMAKVVQFLHRSHINPNIRMQVCKQVKVKLMQLRPDVVKDLEVLDMLPLTLRHTLQLELCNPHLLEHPLLNFLSHADSAMWEETCMTCAHFSVLMSGDHLFVFGARAEGMYFVIQGSLSYDLDDSFAAQMPQEAKAGTWLSEAALWCHWRHMGSAEAQGRRGGCCEALLLRTAPLMPLLTRRGLIGQLAWAYARSFHHFLQNSTPPLCDWPNDLVLPFGVDEVIAAMPKEATAVIGQVAIDVLMAPPESLLDSWLHAVPQGNIQRLASEVMDGGSTLLAIGRRVIVRCVPLVALRLRHQDGRIFVRMKLDSRADGGLEASCKLPGGKQEAGESPHDCLRRLLRGKLRALRDGIAVVGVERQSQQDNSRKFGVPTRYVRTVVLAWWQGSEGDTAALGQLKVHTVDTTLSVASEQHGYGSGEDVASESLAKKPRAKCEKKTSLGIGAQAFMLPEDVGFYTWLTEDQFDFAKSPQGQQSLIDWLSVLYSTVGLNPDVPVEKDAWKRACLSNAGSGKGLGEYELGEEPGSPAALSRRGDVDDPPTAMSDLA
ncbi:unnamed protein product [Prorocentrum cordatum]|uniref:Ion transport domain-containing protein n=1 Tax=Prorocentrum cordatum TaxID=2364126 RepID=A0ABN9VWT0_9DINO|nr:unnamed protein product [Polarella glacialis]